MGSPLFSVAVGAGGTGYSGSAYAQITDSTGSGAAVSLTVAAGVVTGATLTAPGTNYTSPVLNVIDPVTSVAGATFSVSLTATVNGPAAVCA